MGAALAGFRSSWPPSSTDEAGRHSWWSVKTRWDLQMDVRVAACCGKEWVLCGSVRSGGGRGFVLRAAAARTCSPRMGRTTLKYRWRSGGVVYYLAHFPVQLPVLIEIALQKCRGAGNSNSKVAYILKPIYKIIIPVWPTVSGMQTTLISTIPRRTPLLCMCSVFAVLGSRESERVRTNLKTRTVCEYSRALPGRTVVKLTGNHNRFWFTAFDTHFCLVVCVV